jgi:hypothetical protein
MHEFIKIKKTHLCYAATPATQDDRPSVRLPQPADASRCAWTATVWWSQVLLYHMSGQIFQQEEPAISLVLWSRNSGQRGTFKGPLATTTRPAKITRLSCNTTRNILLGDSCSSKCRQPAQYALSSWACSGVILSTVALIHRACDKW